MLYIKIFEAPDADELENNVNDWLADNENIEITHVTQSESAVADTDGDFCGNTTLSIMYRKR